MNPIVYEATLSVLTKVYEATLAVEEKTYTADLATVINATIIDVPQYEGPYTVTPTESRQILETNELMMQDDVTVNAIPSNYVGSAVARQSELSTSGLTVTAAAGYYPNSVSKSVTPNLEIKASTYSPTESIQTDTITSGQGYDGIGEVNVTINAIPGNYVGSQVTRRSSADLDVTGATVTAPAGYYSNEAHVSVQAGTAGTPTAIIGDVTNHTVTVTPSVTNSTGYISGGTIQGAGVDVSASDLVSGSQTIRNNSTVDVTNLAEVIVDVPPFVPTLQTKSKTYTPTTSQQTESVTADSGYDALEEVNITVNAMPSGSATTPTTTITANPGITVGSDGLITVSISTYKNITPTVNAGYVASGTSGKVTVSGSNTEQLSTQAGSTITPTRSQQTAVASGKYTTGAVLVDPIPSEYIIPSGSQTVTINNTYDVTSLAEMVVAVPSDAPTLQTKSVSYTPTTSQQTDIVMPDTGYDALDKVNVTVAAMPAGSAGTPTATKGTVSNHSIQVTPKVTNTAGYITGGTKTGTAVTVSASELVSGAKSITQNGTGIDVTNYETVNVAVPSSSPNLQSKSVSYTPSETAQSDTVTADTGYDGLDEVSVSVGAISSTYVGSGITRRSSSDLTASGATVTVPAGYYASQGSKSVSSGSATPPTTISGSQASLTTGTNTITLQKTLSVTPQVSAGYISSGTNGNVLVSLNANVTTKGTATITPGTTNQTISSGTYLTGTQTIEGDSNLIASNIKKDVQIFGVTGSYEGSGGGGASNFVTGTFTTGSSAGVGSVTIDYSGSGYPIMCYVVVDNGAYNNTSTGDTNWYNSVQRYAIGVWAMSKSNFTTAPTYSTSGSANQAVTMSIYKNSTSQSTTYTRTSAMNTNTFSSSNASNAAATTIRFKANKTLSYYVNTSSYGLLPSTTYRYFIVYSS